MQSVYRWLAALRRFSGDVKIGGPGDGEVTDMAKTCGERLAC